MPGQSPRLFERPALLNSLNGKQPLATFTAVSLQINRHIAIRLVSEKADLVW
jgi:hypothetical protein